MKQEWRSQGKGAKAGLVTSLLWLCLSFPWVVPSELCLHWSWLRLGLLGCVDPGLERSQQGTEQPEPADDPAVDDLAQSHLLEGLGFPPRSVSPRTHILQAPSSVSPVQGGLVRPCSHTGASLHLSYGPSPALSCPGPPRVLVEWLRRHQDGCSCLTHSPFPFVTEEAALELKFKDFCLPPALVPGILAGVRGFPCIKKDRSISIDFVGEGGVAFFLENSILLACLGGGWLSPAQPGLLTVLRRGSHPSCVTCGTEGAANNAQRPHQPVAYSHGEGLGVCRSCLHPEPALERVSALIPQLVYPLLGWRGCVCGGVSL
ncbi:hypothetical protein DV515_00012918, partial [Chloebia gouldiae]